MAQAELREHEREAKHERGAERQHDGIIKQGGGPAMAGRMQRAYDTNEPQRCGTSRTDQRCNPDHAERRPDPQRMWISLDISRMAGILLRTVKLISTPAQSTPAIL
jgi:hypothetical protein